VGQLGDGDQSLMPPLLWAGAQQLKTFIVVVVIIIIIIIMVKFPRVFAQRETLQHRMCQDYKIALQLVLAA